MLVVEELDVVVVVADDGDGVVVDAAVVVVPEREDWREERSKPTLNPVLP